MQHIFKLILLVTFITTSFAKAKIDYFDYDGQEPKLPDESIPKELTTLNDSLEEELNYEYQPDLNVDDKGESKKEPEQIQQNNDESNNQKIVDDFLKKEKEENNDSDIKIDEINYEEDDDLFTENNAVVEEIKIPDSEEDDKMEKKETIKEDKKSFNLLYIFVPAASVAALVLVIALGVIFKKIADNKRKKNPPHRNPIYNPVPTNENSNLA